MADSRLVRAGTRLVIGLALAFWPLVASAAAGDSGRWWWDAEVGFGQRIYVNRVGDFENYNRQGEVLLGGGLNGFIVHPAVARFRIGLNFLLARNEFGRRLDSNRVGFLGSVQLFSRSAYPLSLYYRQQFWGYSQPGTDDPISLLRSPDGGTRWGASILASRGPFRGVRAGVEAGTIDYLDPLANREYDDRRYLAWSRSGEKFRHRVRLEGRYKEYGTIDLGYDDYTLNINEGGMVTPRTQWDLSVIGVHRRNFQTEAGLEYRTQNYRLANRLSWKLSHHATFDLNNNIGMFRPQNGPWSTLQGMSAFYRRRVGSHWEVAPNALFAIQSAGGFQSSTPQMGVDVAWRTARGKLAAQLGGGVAFGLVSRADGDMTEDGTTSSLVVRGSMTHGEARGLLKEFEFSAGRNETIIDREPIPELPDLDLSGTLISTRNRYRARITLRHDAEVSEYSGWGEWTRRDTGAGDVVGPLDFEALTGNFVFNRRRLNLLANAGLTTVKRTFDEEQSVRFVGAAAHWQAMRRLFVRASYRLDYRDVFLEPTLDGARWELGTGIQFGFLLFEARIYQHYQEVLGASSQTNSGITWSLKSRFAGWLPIVTGTGRRGQIR